MSAGTPFVRTLRLLALLVQLSFPGLATLADARLEREAAAEPAHVESQSHDCDAERHPADCAICQVLRGAVVAPELAREVDFAPAAEADRITRDLPRVAQQAPPVLPRGPPLS